MYNEYFGLHDAPFSIAPNPHFLFMSERHREALAHLLYGIRSDGGFILLTGEVGTGKTTMCRCLLEQMPEDVDTAFVLNPKLTARELLASICDDLRIETGAESSIKTLVDRLSDYLLASFERGRRTVLIIDEAQNLSTDVLEQLRLLTNLETNERKLLQIILLGQPELLAILEQRELRQLSQRVTARFHLEALNREEVTDYIHHRLEVAGGRPALFSPAAIRRVGKLSGGIPRLINLICDRALLGTYAESGREVTGRIVNRAAAEILGPSKSPQTGRLRFAVAAGLLLAVMSSAMLFVGTNSERAEGPIEVADTEPARETPAPPPEGARSGEQSTAGQPAPEPIVTANLIADEPVLDSLLAVEGEPTRAAAIARLMSLWETPLTGEATDPCRIASDFGLQCLDALGSLRDVRHLNRPAVIRLTIAGLEHFVVLSRVEETSATVISSSGRFRLSRRDLLRSWDGQYLLIWRPPPDYQLVQRGDQGAAVEQLARHLALADRDAAVRDAAVRDAAVRNAAHRDTVAPGIQTFDDALENRLKRFQISVGLRPDGMAGAQTWIHLNEAAGMDVPRLDRGRT